MHWLEITCLQLDAMIYIYTSEYGHVSCSTENVPTHCHSDEVCVFFALLIVSDVTASPPPPPLAAQCGWAWSCGNQGEFVHSLIGVIKDELSRFHPGVIFLFVFFTPMHVRCRCQDIFLWFWQSSWDWDLVFGLFGGKISKVVCIPALLLNHRPN